MEDQRCPYLRKSSYHTCQAAGGLFIPSIEELERYCLSPCYFDCELYKIKSEDELSSYINPARFRCEEDGYI